jgi:hypothetical protein
VTSDEQPSPPLLRIVHGGVPRADEVAALVVVLSARTGRRNTPPQPLRRPLSSWVASGITFGISVPGAGRPWSAAGW